MRAEQWSAVVTHHGEGPGWDPHARRLRIVDQLAGDLVTLAPDGTVEERRHLGAVLAAWRPRRAGGLVLAVERGFALLGTDGTLTTGPEQWTDPTIRMNDGACDPSGAFYCGSMAYDARPGAARVHRLAPDGTTSVAHTGVTVSNGLVWAADGTFAYYTDTATGTVSRVTADPESGRFTDVAPWVSVDPATGAPDGIALDAEGGVWVALWGGSAVHRYTPDGTLDAVVAVGARQVSACAFGGDDGGTLYLTTSRQHLTADEDPAAGAVFAVRPGVTGHPLSAYAG
ncbi:SMP-30/gluconolactonase/LRE family protein [Streptomyces sp. NPDC091377]|uniref:SMP-30/gluconolactonase/LRE family protein n=1 Tax=Streptomyces sp. NPDC091377 TaxID=3365995 RepID=UPI0038157A98